MVAWAVQHLRFGPRLQIDSTVVVYSLLYQVLGEFDARGIEAYKCQRHQKCVRGRQLQMRSVNFTYLSFQICWLRKNWNRDVP